MTAHTDSTWRILLVLLAAIVWAGPLRAQEATPRIEVGLDRAQIYEGESVLYTVTIRNAREPKTPDLSQFSDFSVKPAGEQSLNSSRVTIINGRVTREETFGRAYGFLLTPRRSGTLTVPAPTAEADGHVLRGHALELTVVAPEAQDLAILAVAADRARVYPLQPFVITLRIFLHRLPEALGEAGHSRDPVSVTDPPALQVPWTEVPEGLEAESTSDWLSPRIARQKWGFTVNGIASRGSVFSFFEDRPAVFDLDGHPATAADVAGIPRLDGRAGDYWVYRLARRFTPKRAGRYRFGPVTLKGLLAEEVRGGRLRGRNVYAVGAAEHVTVSNVPQEGKPASFTGAVGTFAITSEVAPRRVRVGDPMTFTLTVTGEGNLEDVGPPDLTRLEEVTAGFKVYEATAATRGSRRVFTYSLRPVTAMVSEVPSVPFAFFDVARERYVTVATEPIAITVEPATRLSAEEILAGTGERRSAKEIEARKGGLFANVSDPRQVLDEGVRPLGHGLYLATLLIAYCLSALLIGRWRRLRGDPLLIRRRAAAGRARQRLAAALGGLAGGGAEAAVEFRGAIAGLAADAAGVPEAGLTGREIAERFQTLGVPEALAMRAERMVEACDGARYGGGPGSSEPLANEARGLLEDLIRALRRGGRLR